MLSLSVKRTRDAIFPSKGISHGLQQEKLVWKKQQAYSLDFGKQH